LNSYLAYKLTAVSILLHSLQHNVLVLAKPAAQTQWSESLAKLRIELIFSVHFCPTHLTVLKFHLGTPEFQGLFYKP